MPGVSKIFDKINLTARNFCWTVRISISSPSAKHRKVKMIANVFFVAWINPHLYEAFQGVWATSDIASKCGDNLLPKYRRKKRQFAKTTIHFSFRQSDNCTFFLRRLHGCHMNLYRKTTATISSAGQATKVHKRMRQGDKTTPLGRPLIWVLKISVPAGLSL